MCFNLLRMHSLGFFLLFLFAFVKRLSAEPRAGLFDNALKDWKESGEGTPPFESLTTPEMIEAFGYVAETHHVKTKDGYILGLHRIPYGKAGPSEELRPIAFVQHGLLCSSSDWVMDKPGRALAYLLADAGYDVWMGNSRGNTYSRNHTTLDPDVDKKQFWEFSWNEMGIYDTPAAIDYALKITGNTQVYYIGYSMGTTMFFVLMSEKPEYAEKIKVVALMAPVTYTDHIKGPFEILVKYFDNIERSFESMGEYEFLPSDKVTKLLSKACGSEDFTQPICYNIIFSIAGFDEEEMNKVYLPIVLSHTPAGTSMQTVNHYAQVYHKNVFQKYDWGLLGNKKHYGQFKPPKYNLKAKTPDIAIYWGQNDYLAAPKDVERLRSELVNVVKFQRVEWDKWTHLDFIWGLHAKEYVYDYLIDFIAQY